MIRCRPQCPDGAAATVVCETISTQREFLTMQAMRDPGSPDGPQATISFACMRLRATFPLHRRYGYANLSQGFSRLPDDERATLNIGFQNRSGHRR